MDPTNASGELLTYVISGLAMLWGVVAGGQRVGVIPRKDGNPALTQTLEAISAAMQTISTTMHAVAEDVAVLRRQHGPPAVEGEYEAWKLSPLDRRNLSAASKKAHAAATMLEVSLRMHIDEVVTDAIEGDARREHLGSARKALADWDATRSEFT